MTLREFFKRARRVQWMVQVLKSGERVIRTRNPLKPVGKDPTRQRLCPLAYVLRSWYPRGEALQGIGFADANRIIDAADGDAGWRGRYRLKRALGLAR